MVAKVETVEVGDRPRRYSVLLIPAEGRYAVEVPTLPGCFTHGATVEEALDRAREAIQAHIAALEADCDPVPVEDEAPSLVAVEV